MNKGHVEVRSELKRYLVTLYHIRIMEPVKKLFCPESRLPDDATAWHAAAGRDDDHQQ